MGRMSSLWLALFACLLLAPAIMRGQGTVSSVSSTGDVVFADFEDGTYDGWTLTGNCWGNAPASDQTFAGKITGFQGKRFLCTLDSKLGNAATGKAASKEFTLEKPFLNFLIGGGNHPNETCMNLVIDGKVVLSETGDDSPGLRAVSWKVSLWAGKRAHLEIVDTSQSAERGYVMVDDIRFSSAPTVSKKNAAYDRVDFNEQYDHANLDTPFQKSVTQLGERVVSQYHIVGATVVCVLDGKLVAAVAVGERKLGSGVPIQVTDPMHIGSNTKGMTALVFARMVEQGKLKWNQTPYDVFPMYRDKINPDFAKVPLVEFLHQRSGRSPDAPVYTGPDYSKYIPLPEEKGRLNFALDCLAQPIAYPPGSKFVYSNSNYTTRN